MADVSYHVSAGNSAWVLWKISLCSLTTEPSLQPELAAFLARSSLVSFATSSRDARSNEPASLSSLFHTCSKVLCTEEPSDELPLTREQTGSPNACVLHSPSNSAHPPCSLCYPRSLQPMQTCWVGERASDPKTTGEIHSYN